MASCDVDYEEEGGTVGSCALPAGHAGAHGDGPTPAQRLAERADALTAVATEETGEPTCWCEPKLF